LNLKLDHEEVQVLMRKSGEEVGFARVGEIIAQIDKNNDGKRVLTGVFFCFQP